MPRTESRGRDLRSWQNAHLAIVCERPQLRGQRNGGVVRLVRSARSAAGLARALIGRCRKRLLRALMSLTGLPGVTSRQCLMSEPTPVGLELLASLPAALVVVGAG